jgi:MYXO-CTERM domain-containing protein
MKVAWVAAFALATIVLMQGTASADLLDPPDIHFNGPNGTGGLATAGFGTDWVTLPSFTGEFSVEDISNKKGLQITPWHLILALPGTTGAITDSITKIGTTTLTTPIVNSGESTLTATTDGGDAYKLLGVTGSGVPNSIKFVNFVAADQTVVGGPAPTQYGLYDFVISSSTLELLDKVVNNVDISGTLPAGTIIFAYGEGNDGKTYTTAFTNAGVITPNQFTPQPTPEPSSIAVAGLGALGLLAYGLRRRRAK